MQQKRSTILHPEWGTIIITHNARARRMILRARRDAIYITLPPFATKKDVENALTAHGSKLKEQQSNIPERSIQKRFTIEAESFSLRLQQSPVHSLRLTGSSGTYTLHYPATLNFEDEATQQKLRHAINAALTHRAKETLPARLAQLAALHNMHYTSCTIRNCHTRWGSCSSRGTISLSSYLVLLPQQLIDYVLRHELCHTVEMNHGPRFWALLDTLCGTSSKALRAELKSYNTLF